MGLLTGCHNADGPKSVEGKSERRMKIAREQFIGRWKSTEAKRELLLHEDGASETWLGSTEHYRGTWRFSPPHQLLVRAVIPHNNPDIDDELNAHEMCFEIREFASDRFTAMEFDEEGLKKFRRM